MQANHGKAPAPPGGPGRDGPLEGIGSATPIDSLRVDESDPRVGRLEEKRLEGRAESTANLAHGRPRGDLLVPGEAIQGVGAVVAEDVLLLETPRARPWIHEEHPGRRAADGHGRILAAVGEEIPERRRDDLTIPIGA